MLFNILFTYPKVRTNEAIQYSSMLQYMLFHAAPDRNWFLRLMSQRCAKVVVDWGGEGCTIFVIS